MNKKLLYFALFVVLVGVAFFVGPGLVKYTDQNPQPAALIQSRATGLCKDGTETYAVNHRGACSHHDGVERWY